MATKVSLRKKPMSKNRLSLYLDFYPPITDLNTGKLTRREFLGFYVFDKPKNPIDKEHNKQTFAVAESIRQKRQNILDKPEIYSDFEKKQLKIRELGEQDYIKYFKSLANKRKTSNYDNWMSAYLYLERFANGNIKFADLNEKFLSDFKDYLLTKKVTKVIK